MSGNWRSAWAPQEIVRSPHRNGRAASQSCLYPTGACSAPWKLPRSQPCNGKGLAAQSSRSESISFFAEHANGASGNLKTRRRSGSFSVTDCRELVKTAQAIGDVLWNLLNSALWIFSPSTPAVLQVFSRREGGLATFLRLAAELL